MKTGRHKEVGPATATQVISKALERGMANPIKEDYYNLEEPDMMKLDSYEKGTKVIPERDLNKVQERGLPSNSTRPNMTKSDQDTKLQKVIPERDLNNVQERGLPSNSTGSDMIKLPLEET